MGPSHWLLFPNMLLLVFFDLFRLDGCLYTCSLVIMEGDPHPGAINGRMSFQSFNPSIDVSIKVMWPEISNDYSPPVILFWLLFSSCKALSW